MIDQILSVDPAGLDPEEVFQVLLQHFGSASMETGRARFQRGQDAWIDIEVNESRRITKVQSGPRVAPDQLAAIRREIDAALVVDQRLAVGQRVGFCATPITGWYRYRDIFQILPVPSAAPKPDVRGWANHPFLIQYAYIWSANLPVRYQRREHQALTHLRLLDLLAGMRIHGEPRSGHKVWLVGPPTEDPSRQQSEYRQLGYAYPGLAGEIDGFSDVSDIEPVGFFPGRDYLSHPRVFGHSLELPDNIGDALDAAFSLRDVDRERFNRALIYLEHAKSVWAETRSLAYVALVMAIEALMDKPDRCETCNQPLREEVGRCNTCSQPVFGTTRAFREFLETHAPGIKTEPRIRNRLYGLRSDLAHGNDVLLVDSSPMAHFSTYLQEESEIESRLWLIADTAVRSWLSQRAQTRN